MSPDPEHCCSVALVVVGVDLDPDAVSAALGMVPHQSWRRGERKSFTRPDGTTHVFESVHDEGGWKRFVSDRLRDAPLGTQLRSWVSRLRGLRGPLGDLRGRGWVAELNCFAASREVLTLTQADLRVLVDLGIDLALALG